MDTPSPPIRDLARRLLAVEAARQSAADARVPEAVRVCEKLRISISRFAGVDGFTALLRRALVLAQAEVPALKGSTWQPDGSMEGLEKFVAEAGNSGVRAGDAAVAITAHLLGLLVTFIGESLTVRLACEAWPEVSLDERI